MRRLTIRERQRQDRRIVAVFDPQREISRGAGEAAVGGRHTHREHTDIGIGRRAAEGLAGRVEAQPCGQRSAIGQRGFVGQGITGISVGEGPRRQGEGEGRVLHCSLCRERRRQHRRVVGTGDREQETRAAAEPPIGDRQRDRHRPAAGIGGGCHGQAAIGTAAAQHQTARGQQRSV